MDLKQIKQIIDLMKRSELTEFAVEEEGFKLKIRRGANGLPVVSSGRGSNSPFPTGGFDESESADALCAAGRCRLLGAPSVASAEEAGRRLHQVTDGRDFLSLAFA